MSKFPISDCHGTPFSKGDRVLTRDGRILEVKGFARWACRASDCEVVSPTHPLSKDEDSKAAGDGDTVVWGN